MELNNNLKGQNILLMGSCGVLGVSHIKAIVNSGANIVIADKPGSKVLELAKEYAVLGVEADCTSENDIIKLAAQAYKTLGRIDSAIYNSAITSEGLLKISKDAFPPFIEYPLSLWNESININLTGAFIFAREIGKIFEEQNHGNLVLMSSIYGNVGPDHSIYSDVSFNTFPGYSASKAGIIGLMKWLATLWGPKNIRVNSISPGGVYNNQDINFVKLYASRTPLGRMARPEEVTSLLMYLLHPSSSYCTGQNYMVDGGLTTW